MSYSALTAAEIASGKPVTADLWQKVKDNLDYLYGLIGTQAAIGVQNGSFEIDSDSDGVPDGWTKSLYAGGSGALYTTSPAHGATSWSFVHPGGASNGGGYLDSDYIEVSQYLDYAVRFIHWATAAGMKNKVQVRYFDKDKSELGAGSPEDLYNSTANPTTATCFKYNFVPPATTRYIKIRLIGGYTDTNVAGTAYFDDVALEAAPAFLAVAPIQADTTETTYTKVKEIEVNVPGKLTVSFQMKTSSAGHAGYGKVYINGVAAGTERAEDAAAWTMFQEVLTVAVGDLVQLYGKAESGYTSSFRHFTVQRGEVLYEVTQE